MYIIAPLYLSNTSVSSDLEALYKCVIIIIIIIPAWIYQNVGLDHRKL